jgi:hypothetical protein
MKTQDKKKLDDYFQKKLGIKTAEVIGHISVIKKDIRVLMEIKPPDHYTMDYEVLVKKGVKIKINGFGKYGLQPLGYSNYLTFEILDPQVELGQLTSTMELLADVLVKQLAGLSV